MKNEILEIKYFLLPFSIYIFSLIVFDNLYVYLSIFFVLFILYAYFSYKYKNISFLTLLFFVSSLSIFSYLYFTKNIYDQYSGYEKMFFTKRFVIDDILVDNRYIVRDDFGNNFILKNTAKNYKIWEKLKVYGMFYPIKLKYKNFKDFLLNKFLSYNVDLSKIKNIFNFNYTKYLVMKNIIWTIYSKHEYSIWKEKLAVYRQLRQDMVNKINNVYNWYDDRYKALTLGLLIWDKSYLSKELYNQFIHSWLVHIIVVSGWNIMFLIIFLSIVFFFVPFYFRLFLIWWWIIFYSFMVWIDSSVIRATIMWLLSLVALFFGKVTDVRRMLAIAFILMLVYNPYFLLYDLWFILSFLAILWILVFNHFAIEKNKENKLKNSFIYFYNNYILPTIWASLFTTPAILLFINQVNLLAFLASIFVVPLVPLLMLSSFLMILFPQWFILNCLLHFNVYIIDYVFNISYLFWDKFTLFLKL